MEEKPSLLKQFFTALTHNLLPLAVLIGLLFLGATSAPLVLEFKPNFMEEAQRLIGSLLLVTVFLERALEVFVITWRGPRSNELDALIAQKAEQIAAESKRPERDPQKLEALNREMEQLQKERLEYKSDTQRMALWGGLLMGVIIGVAGLRVLSGLLTNLDKLQGIQQIIFHATDVLLTGGLLAGGSDGVHKIYKVYSEFMDATASKAKASNPASETALRAEARASEVTPATPAPGSSNTVIETPFGGSVG